MNRLRIPVAIVSIMLVLLGWVAMAAAVHAASTTIDVGYPSFTQATSPADFVNKLYQYALGIAGTLAVLSIVYGGVKYLISAGNESSLSDAKDIIKSAIWGILLLAGAYLVLSTINPQLVELRNPKVELVSPAPTSTTGGGTGGPTGGGAVTPPGDAQAAALANQLINSDFVSFSVNADCGSGTDARAIIRDVANTAVPLVCSPSCSCTRGGPDGSIGLSDNMLSTLVKVTTPIDTTGMGDFIIPPKIIITSLTGGIHAANSYHYKGRAADIVLPGTNNPTDWSNFAKDLIDNGAATARCEVGGKFDTCDKLFSGGKLISGGHIHAEW